MARFPVRAVGRLMLGIASLVLVGAIGLTVSACSRDPQAAQTDANAPIGVETSSLLLTIENRAGTPLVDMTVTIVPAGGTPFTHLISRIEVGEKREASLSEFSSRDGTSFSLRLARPQRVRVQAKDLTGKAYSVEVPWK